MQGIRQRRKLQLVVLPLPCLLLNSKFIFPAITVSFPSPTYNSSSIFPEITLNNQIQISPSPVYLLLVLVLIRKRMSGSQGCYLKQEGQGGREVNIGRKEVCKWWGNNTPREVTASAKFTIFSLKFISNLQSELKMHSNLEQEAIAIMKENSV